MREGMTMALYVAIVLLATLTALPTGSETEGGGHDGGGVHGLPLIGLIWGTTIGLALAHWFAFRLAARTFGGGRVSAGNLAVGLAQLAGAAVVGLLCTIPVLLADDADDVQAATWVPAAVVGIAGYAVGRASGRTKAHSLLVGLAVTVYGLTVASVKNFLLGH
jgi:FtsH-binding integral membrane protein